jgi:hypothetical protein
VGQDHLNGFATFIINCGLRQKLGFSLKIIAFSDKNARKAFVKWNTQFGKLKDIWLQIRAIAEKVGEASVKLNSEVNIY